MLATKYKAKRFLLPILSLVLVLIIAITSISSYITISMFKMHMQERIEGIKKEYTEKNKSKIYEEVHFIKDSIKFQIGTIENRLKADLKEKVKIALDIAKNTYDTYKKTHTKKEIKEKISRILSEIKFNNNRVYYFMYDNKTKILLTHQMKKFIGKDMTDFKDTRGRSLMETDAKILEKEKIGFNKIYFNKPNNQKEEFPKITCIAKFEALDLVIGLGEYLDVIETQTKKYALERFSKFEYKEKDRYLVILDIHNIKGGDDFATVLLNSNKPELVGTKVSDKETDIKGNRFRKEFLDLVVKKDNGYYEYWYQKPSTNSPAPKMSYFHLQKDWNWIIASGFYYDNLDKQVSIMKKLIISRTNETINKTLIWVSLLSLLSILVAIFVSLRIDKTIKEYTDAIVDYEDKKRNHEYLLIQQSKMAAMGEMIGNIAHQWRQPLSAISTSATGAQLQKEMNCLSDTQLNTTFDTINKSAQYLSSTIDDFRSFFNPSNNNVSEFNISNLINTSLNLISAQFTAKEIEIIQNIENFKLVSIENELMQVLINILNNAKDALVKLENQKKLIFINTYKNDKNIIIEIKDNAKGVPEDIIDRIFEPYFTTKHKSQGTGIGLYMSEEIVRTHLNGILSVENETYTFEGIKYTGAKFIIKIFID